MGQVPPVGGPPSFAAAGGAGGDVLFGHSTGQFSLDNETLLGGSGNDRLIGGFGDDVLDGGADNDLLSLGTIGTDIATGGSGLDVFSFVDGLVFDVAPDPDKMTAAHKTLAFGTVVRVTRVDNSRSVTVRINDRGPFVEGRIIDLSERAARDLDMIAAGVMKVRVEVTGGNPDF